MLNAGFGALNVGVEVVASLGCRSGIRPRRLLAFPADDEKVGADGDAEDGFRGQGDGRRDGQRRYHAGAVQPSAQGAFGPC